MFGPITLPLGVKMLFNTVKLKRTVGFDPVGLVAGEMCVVLRETSGGGEKIGMSIP